MQLRGLCPPSGLGVFNNNLENGYRAFAERYFMCKTTDGFRPAYTTTMGATLCDSSRDFIERVCTNLDLPPVASIRKVVEAYTGHKRKVYEQAEKKFWCDGVSKMDATLRSFVKK